MKKSAKSILAVLLAAVMAFGVYLPISGKALLDLFSVEASAASVTSSETGYWKAFIPANVTVQGYETATSTKNYRKLSAKNYEYTVTFTAKYYLSDGSVRYFMTDASGYNIYFIVPSSVSIYRMPDNPSSCDIDLYTCRDKNSYISFPASSYADAYYVELYKDSTYYLSGYYYSSSGYVNISFNLSDLLTPICGFYTGLTLVIKPYRIINGSYYNSSWKTYNDVAVNSCGKANSHLSYGINYFPNGGSGGPSVQGWPNTCSGSTTITYSEPTRSGYEFLGWSESENAAYPTYYPGDTVYFDHNSLALYAVWSKNPTYTVYYNANGGWGEPSSQTKTKDTTLWLSSTKPSKSYTVSYNANGGSVSPTSKSAYCTFNNWNTAQNGSGTSYSSGSSYTANSGATLYAQWSNPTYGTLPTPTRSGYTFSGWYTSSSGGTRVYSYSTVPSSITLYAHWNKVAEENVYNLGEETYSFSNFGDSDSAGGHCFGMSVTSSGYYSGKLDISNAGVNSSKMLYSVSLNSSTKAPICHYQAIQGNPINKSIVAADSPFVKPYNVESDWQAVVNYVKGHSHDNKGTLQVLSYVKSEGAHAVNFLYYNNVNGQDRIYVYDNNFPTVETYYYVDSYGKIRQAPYSSFDNALDSIAIMDSSIYFEYAESYDFSRVIYAYEGEITVDGVEGCPMYGANDGQIKYVYEIPENANQVKIIPLVDNAEFEYLDESYSFGKVNDETYGEFNLITIEGGNGTQSPNFTIKNESKSIWDIIADFFMTILGIFLLPFSFLF